MPCTNVHLKRRGMRVSSTYSAGSDSNCTIREQFAKAACLDTTPAPNMLTDILNPHSRRTPICMSSSEVHARAARRAGITVPTFRLTVTPLFVRF
ncbi:hypothetical protein J6590_029455 [Homalodisca vitripennis]|nr:hypothetical protein J6590_029455 [Homalodisca vitripennis]